jgi:hypothetical protein
MIALQPSPTTTVLSINNLSIQLAGKDGLRWAQEQVIAFHYLHHPVDVRCSPLAYHVLLEGERVGCLIFGRTESTKCLGWYGSVEDVRSGKCRLTRWELLNLARVWLHPSLQQGNHRHIKNAATYVIAQALRRVPYDFLINKPPVFPEEPYEVRECLSYCDTRIHHGTLYKASNFKLVRKNDYGIETYAIPLRRLTHAERAHILVRSQQDKRAQKLRLAKEYQQLAWTEGSVGEKNA